MRTAAKAASAQTNNGIIIVAELIRTNKKKRARCVVVPSSFNFQSFCLQKKLPFTELFQESSSRGRYIIVALEAHPKYRINPPQSAVSLGTDGECIIVDTFYVTGERLRGSCSTAVLSVSRFFHFKTGFKGCNSDTHEPETVIKPASTQPASS